MLMSWLQSFVKESNCHRQSVPVGLEIYSVKNKNNSIIFKKIEFEIIEHF